jgi:Flp pilus assembly protein TadD
MKRVLVAAILLLAVALLSLTLVGTGEVVVRESHGGQATVLDPGLRVRLFPLHRLFRYPAAPRRIDEALEIVARDNATFHIPIRLSARISRGDVLTFHRECGGRDPGAFIEETAREAVRLAARGLNADEILHPSAAARLAQVVSAELIGRGISDDGLQIGAIRPQVAFNAVVDYLNRQFVASGRKLAERLLSAAPDEALYHAAMGMVHEAEGDAAAAERAYLESLYLNPAAPEPMSRLFLILQSRGDADSLQQLRRLLDAAVHKTPVSAVHHDWLGQILLRLGRLEEAQASFDTALRLAPNTPSFHISLGSLRAARGDVAAARSSYEKALELQPDHALALFNIGTTYAMEKDLDRALDYFRRAEGAGPPNPAILNALAHAYEQQGDAARAADYLRRSLALKPEQPDRRADLKRLEARLR